MNKTIKDKLAKIALKTSITFLKEVTSLVQDAANGDCTETLQTSTTTSTVDALPDTMLFSKDDSATLLNNTTDYSKLNSQK